MKPLKDVSQAVTAAEILAILDQANELHGWIPSDVYSFESEAELMTEQGFNQLADLYLLAAERWYELGL